MTTLETSAPSQTARERAREDATRRRPNVVLRWLGAVATALVILACAALVAVIPTVTLAALGLILVIALAVLAPPFALIVAMLLLGFEGVIKVGLAREVSRLGVSADALGAAVIDAGLLVAIVGIVCQDRGRTLLAIWRNAGRWTRIALALLAAWLVLSLLQLPVLGDIETALAGFRLTQSYVLVGLAGAMLLARARPEHVVNALVGVLLVIAAYGAFRAVGGPSESERLAAFARATTPLVPSEGGVIFRNTGSLSSAIGLASLLVPAGVFLFALGMFVVRLRLAAWSGVALVLVALVGTYVRTSLMAVALGTICTLAFATFTSGVARGTKIRLGLASIPLLGVLLVLGALLPSAVSGGSQEVQQRSSGILRPLSDASLQVRLEHWRGTLDVVQAHPLGTGVGTVGRATLDEGRVTFADNSYLKVLHEQGPLGAVPFMLGVFATLIAAAGGAARRERYRRALGLAAAGGSFSFFLLAWTSEAIEQPGKALAWLLLGIALWAAFGAHERREPAAKGAG